MRAKKLVCIGLILMLLAVLTGCTGADAGVPSAGTQNVDVSKTQADLEEPADWPDKIVIVQMPNEANPDANTKHDGFRKAAEEYIGVTVEEIEGSEYAVGIEAMKSGKLDVMLVSPMSYYQAKTVAGAEPLVTTGTMSAAPYKSVFVTKGDRADINSLEDLRGKSFAFVDPASSSGYMYPKAELVVSLGLDADLLENPDYFFETVTYSGKHDTSVMGVAMGDYDAAAIALPTIEQMENAGLISAGELKIVGETQVIPNACFVIRSDLPQALKDKIKAFYLQYDDSEYFETLYSDGDTRFIEATDADYAVVDEMIQILKIETGE